MGGGYADGGSGGGAEEAGGHVAVEVEDWRFVVGGVVGHAADHGEDGWVGESF